MVIQVIQFCGNSGCLVLQQQAAPLSFVVSSLQASKVRQLPISTLNQARHTYLSFRQVWKSGTVDACSTFLSPSQGRNFELGTFLWLLWDMFAPFCCTRSSLVLHQATAPLLLSATFSHPNYAGFISIQNQQRQKPVPGLALWKAVMLGECSIFLYPHSLQRRSH